jgi:hypothetical protein
MPRKGPSYGVPGYRRGTGLKVGRAARRHRSPWRRLVLTPLAVLAVLLAAGLVVSVVINLASAPPAPRQAASGVPGATTVGKSGVGTKDTGRTTAGTGAGKPVGGGRGAVPTHATKPGGSRTGATPPSKAHGRGAVAPSATGGGVTLVQASAGIDRYTAARAPIVATLRVAWPSWVSVLADGRQALHRLETTGYTATYSGRKSLDVYLGFPQGSTLSVNGTRIGPFSQKTTLWLDITVTTAR